MFSITAKFKEHSIKFRILVIVLPVVILSYIILLSSFYMIYVKESRNNILLEHEENTLSIAKNTASYFSSLNSNIDLLLYGTEIQSLIHSYADKKLSPEEVQSQCNTLFSTYLLGAQSKIQRVYIVLTDNGIISNQTIYNSTLEQQEQKLEQLSEYLKQPKGTLCYYYSPKEPYTITAAKNIFDIQKPEKKIGILLTEINIRFMEDMITEHQDSEYSYYSLFQNSDLVYTTSPYAPSVTASMNMNYHSHRGNSNFYAIRYSVNDFLQIGGLLNTTGAFHSINRVWRQLLVISIFFLLILVFAVIQISRTISQEFQVFITKLKQTSVADETALIHTVSSNEFSELTKEYNHMLLRLQKSGKKITEQQILLKNAELKTLQAQINPHFLYNTLDIIVWMIENEQKSEAVRVVTALARFFRISLSKGKSIIPVRDELEHVRNYLMIQQMRFKNKFTYTIDAAPEVLGYASLKLMLQPLVENAIYHGMEFKDGDGIIEIKAEQKEDGLWFTVLDNGLGMTEEQVENLLTDHAHVSSKRGSGIGVKNVNERIRLYFGNEYGLFIESEPDEGTTIRIHLPAVDYREIQEKEKTV